MKASRGVVFAGMAGLCAALASTLGKLAADSTSNLVTRFLCDTLAPNGGCMESQAMYFFRTSSFIGMLYLNAIMWGYFVKSLSFLPTVNATVINAATNFFFSASLGYVAFSEQLPMQWWIGAAFIVCGTGLIVAGAPAEKDAQDREHKHKD